MTSSPTQTRTEAARTASQEATEWMAIARLWHPGQRPHVTEDLPATEVAVVRLFNPVDDLERRADEWRYPIDQGDLADLARFGAALARAESEAWAQDRGHIATRAYADRRFLLGDRILHWAVPWLDAMARQYPALTKPANDARTRLLNLGDQHRPAPALSGTEGLVVPGFDGYGPLEAEAPFEQQLVSVWSGAVLPTGYLRELFDQIKGERQLPLGWDRYPGARTALESTFTAAARRWDTLATTRSGSAQLWRDLANRARRTARKLHRWKPYRDVSNDW